MCPKSHIVRRRAEEVNLRRILRSLLDIINIMRHERLNPLGGFFGIYRAKRYRRDHQTVHDQLGDLFELHVEPHAECRVGAIVVVRS